MFWTKVLRGKKKERKERELGMFWTKDGRGKKENGKEKSVVTWVDEKKRGEKKKEKNKFPYIYIVLFGHLPLKKPLL